MNVSMNSGPIALSTDYDYDYGSEPASFGSAPAPAPADQTSTTSFLVRALLIVLLLALVGFNVFTYLDDITEWFGDTFGAPFRVVAGWLGYAAADTVKTTVDVTAQGAKSAVDIAAGAATSGIDVLQQTIGSTGSTAHNNNNLKTNNNNNNNHKGTGTNNNNNNNNHKGTGTNNNNNHKGTGTNNNNNHNERPSSEAETESSSLETALSHAKKKAPQPDDATSRIQRTGKSGYCYIGEDRGFRSCIKVGEQDTCMSGDIFPTHAICINPRLRQ
jgi:hypothetical protein